MARSRARSISKLQRLLVWRGNGWHAPFGASPPFLLRRILRCGAANSDAQASRERCLMRHCERQRSNPELAREAGLLRRVAPRNDE
jgi:hypothetical protein